MQTVPCEYCGNPINVSAIEIHRKICSKRPGAPQVIKPAPVAVTPKPIVVRTTSGDSATAGSQN